MNVDPVYRDLYELQKRYDALEKERDALLAQLEGRDYEDKITKLQKRLKIAAGLAFTLAYLYAHKHRFVSDRELFKASKSMRLQGESESLNHVRTHALRKALGDDIIESLYAKGWHITERGVAIVEEALAAPL